MKTEIEVENIVCIGCSNLIHQTLSSLPGVFGAKVDPGSGVIIVDHTDEISPAQIEEKLIEKGYKIIAKQL